MTSTPRYRWPAEWEKHDATWIAWPHHEPDWPGKLGPIPWVYAEIVRVLSQYERVEILCHNIAVMEAAERFLTAHDCEIHTNSAADNGFRLHIVPNDRVWLRDSAPTSVVREDGSVALMNWDFNAWAKYDNYELDQLIGREMERITGLPRIEPQRPDGNGDGGGGGGGSLILEGGGIETDGRGTMLVTEEWLLSNVQVRNPGMTREDYERAFREYLGITRTIWLGEGCVGDDTHGHIDDIARFVKPGVAVLAYEEDPMDENHLRSKDNFERLQAYSDIEVVKLPFPRAVTMNGERLPASYANFYIANNVVIVPTFNDPNDRIALNTLAELLPDRTVIGIHAVDLVWGLGTLHCLTQQQTRALA